MSLSERQPVPALAAAYGVPSADLAAVGAAVYGRLFGSVSVTISIDTLGELPVEWRGILQILAMLVTDSIEFARVRGGGRPSKRMRKSMIGMLSAYALSQPAEEFMETVLAEVASTLVAAKPR